MLEDICAVGIDTPLVDELCVFEGGKPGEKILFGRPVTFPMSS